MSFWKRHRDEHFNKAIGALSKRNNSLVGCAGVALLVCALIAVLGVGTGQAQERKRKVPGLDKITGGPNRQAFSGVVQSLDLKHSLLNVNTVQGGVTEIFPIKKNMHVMTAGGDKLQLTALTPGTNVLIYYEQKGDRRSVKEIVILAAGANAAKKSPPPS